MVTSSLHTPSSRPPRLARVPRFADFQSIMRTGIWVSSPHFALHLRLGQGQGSPQPPGTTSSATASAPNSSNRIGALLPKRFAKLAVRRNMLRRQIYGHAHTALPTLSGTLHTSVDCVVRLRATWDASFSSARSPALQTAAHDELATLFTQALEKALRKGSQA